MVPTLTNFSDGGGGSKPAGSGAAAASGGGVQAGKGSDKLKGLDYNTASSHLLLVLIIIETSLYETQAASRAPEANVTSTMKSKPVHTRDANY
jgi:hypothetical protein